MQPVIQAQGLYKNYGHKKALDNIKFSIPQGRIVGLIGPNGAGKTTLLKGILGLMPLKGHLQVLGKDPVRDRITLLEEVSFIADTTTLPGWLTVAQAIAYVDGVHPNFSREKARSFLARTNIQSDNKIKTLSKGMVAQLHLALIMAIDSKLLVLDEPTLGLDIMYRKQFYESLLNDYHNPHKTILITTHQVEEIEGILTDLLFIDHGKILLQTSMEDLPNRFIEVQVSSDKKDHALAMQPLHIRSTVGGYAAIYENPNTTQLASLGNLGTPSVADLFVAMVTHGNKAHSQAVA